MQRNFKPHIKIILGIVSSVTTFSNHADATMCIRFKKCPTIMRLLTNHIDEMAKN
jgi:hypothetical protein